MDKNPPGEGANLMSAAKGDGCQMSRKRRVWANVLPVRAPEYLQAKGLSMISVRWTPGRNNRSSRLLGVRGPGQALMGKEEHWIGRKRRYKTILSFCLEVENGKIG